MSVKGKKRTTETALPQVKVSRKFLLSLYGLIPVVVLLVVMDYVFFNQQLRQFLPQKPSDLIFWSAIFVLPHIIASFITLADKDYLRFYHNRLAIGLFVIVFGVLTLNFVLPLLLERQHYWYLSLAFFIFYSAFTIYHVLSQQFGISMVLMKLKSNGADYERWRWSASIATTLMYLMVFTPHLLTQYSLYPTAQMAAAVLLVLSAIQAVMIAKQTKERRGAYYVYANV